MPKVQLNGILWDKQCKTARNVAFIGDGEIIPEPPPGDQPILLPPGTQPPDPPTESPVEPPNPQWEWGWNPSTGWIPVFIPAQPCDE